MQFPTIPLWQSATAEQRANCLSWGRHHFAEWFAGLDINTKRAIEQFKQQGDSLNNFMRGQTAFEYSEDRQRELGLQISLLNAALLGVMIPHDIVVYRGLRGSFPEDLAPGKGLSDLSFTATSLLLGTAEQFSCWDDPDGIATILAITVPAGHPGAWIEHLMDADMGEYEVLLPPITRLVVESVFHVSSSYELLSPSDHPSQTAPVRRIALCRCL